MKAYLYKVCVCTPSAIITNLGIYKWSSKNTYYLEHFWQQTSSVLENFWVEEKCADADSLGKEIVGRGEGLTTQPYLKKNEVWIEREMIGGKVEQNFFLLLKLITL